MHFISSSRLLIAHTFRDFGDPYFIFSCENSGNTKIFVKVKLLINNEAVSSFVSNQGWNIFEIKQWKVFLSAIVPKDL